MKRIIVLTLIVLIAGQSVPYSLAEADEAAEQLKGLETRPGSEVIDKLKERASKGQIFDEEASAYLPKVWCADIDDESTKAACWKAYKASLNYYQTGLQHRTQVFWWQHVSTRIIFFVVLVLVATGIYFAWIQFKRDMRTGKGSAGDAKEHSVELSPAGIKVSSPVLGVIILTLSLAFFYLYLVYVYPITEIF